MTQSPRNKLTYGIRYYKPSRSLTRYLNEELQNLEPTDPSSLAGKRRKFRRKEEGRGKIAKAKKDTFPRVFQGLVDIVYFLEFIEEHPELHQLYDGPLKDLLGINTDTLNKNGKRSRRRKVWHWSLFVRFLSAALFNRSGPTEGFDFRTALAYVMIFQAVEALRSRLITSGNHDELRLFNSNVSNAELWSKLLADRYKDKQVISRHQLRF